MQRYDDIPIQTRFDGKRVYKSTVYPTIPVSDSDIQIVTSETDYLDSLASKYYGDETLWFIIALANPGLSKGRLSVPPGKTIRIPTDITSILSEFARLNV